MNAGLPVVRCAGPEGRKDEKEAWVQRGPVIAMPIPKRAREKKKSRNRYKLATRSLRGREQ